jgi:hypothetical protein
MPYDRTRVWEVEYTDQFGTWWTELKESDQNHIDAAVLERVGPALGRPLVDTIATSRHANMKELRPIGGTRILFAFDPNRTAMLLIGGDKTGDWNRWYERMVPVADDLYDDHLAEIADTGDR